MRVAVIGKHGQLAQCLAETAPADVELVCFERDEFDLAAPSADLSALALRRPELVINAAAFTAVDAAETDRDAAFALNAHGPARLAEFCAQREMGLIHISTDYVFDGNQTRPYVETDSTAPLNVYGESKLRGEVAVADTLTQHLIIRTSWLYSPFGSNFVKTMLRLAGERDSLRIVSDQIGRPTSAAQLAIVIWNIASQLRAHRDTRSLWGTYHYADRAEMSWADFAAAIFAMPEAELRRAPRIERIASSDYPTPAKRPSYSVLDTTKIESTFGIQPAFWGDSLRAVLSRLKQDMHR
jgi:dTDP-4-dehydrorhamnose reductase